MQKHALRFLLLVLVVFGLVLTGLSTARAQDEQYTKRRQFTQLDNLIRLIEKAREAGFTDEQLQGLELKMEDESINVLDYINSIREKEKQRSLALQAFLKKNFLTVKDIFKELVTLEPQALTELREELISER